MQLERKAKLKTIARQDGCTKRADTPKTVPMARKVYTHKVNQQKEDLRRTVQEALPNFSKNRNASDEKRFCAWNSGPH